MSTDQMLNEIRRIIRQCTAPERDCYEVLVDEATKWEIRLEELEEETED